MFVPRATPALEAPTAASVGGDVDLSFGHMGAPPSLATQVPLACISSTAMLDVAGDDSAGFAITTKDFRRLAFTACGGRVRQPSAEGATGVATLFGFFDDDEVSASTSGKAADTDAGAVAAEDGPLRLFPRLWHRVLNIDAELTTDWLVVCARVLFQPCRDTCAICAHSCTLICSGSSYTCPRPILLLGSLFAC